MIDQDNCYHSGVEMKCEISMITKLNVSLLSLKHLCISFKRSATENVSMQYSLKNQN